MNKTELKQKIELLLDKIRDISGHSSIYNQNEIAALINNTKDLHDSLLIFHFLQQNAEPYSSNEKKSEKPQVAKKMSGIDAAASSNTLQTVGKSKDTEVSINEKMSFSH